jgi:histone-lysine N-methyltransferase SETMAR
MFLELREEMKITRCQIWAVWGMRQEGKTQMFNRFSCSSTEKCDKADLNDKPRGGRPVTATDKSRQDRVDELIRENRRIKQKEIAEALGISKERVGHIISILGYRKVCARWVPRMLTDDINAERVRISQELLQRFENEGDEFL